LARDADAIGTNWAPVTASVIRAAFRCRTVARVLAAGRIAGAALDVFDPEPHDLSDPLYQDERVILTPHAAFVSEESLRELRTRASRQMADALVGVRPANVVNPEVYARTT
jgi:D-3-phosphoglycerate dehydrogenase